MKLISGTSHLRNSWATRATNRPVARICIVFHQGVLVQVHEDIGWSRTLEEARRVRRLAEFINDPRTVRTMLAYADELDRKALDELALPPFLPA